MKTLKRPNQSLLHRNNLQPRKKQKRYRPFQGVKSRKLEMRKKGKATSRKKQKKKKYKVLYQRHRRRKQKRKKLNESRNQLMRSSWCKKRETRGLNSSYLSYLNLNQQSFRLVLRNQMSLKPSKKIHRNRIEVSSISEKMKTLKWIKKLPLTEYQLQSTIISL